MRQPEPTPYLAPFLIGGLLLIAMAAQAGNQQDIEQLLAREEAPFGVVFEIVERDENALQWAIPAIDHYARQLRKRFPDIGLAVVSHGREEFALMKNRQTEHAKVHLTVQSLVADDIPVHVCGTLASWHGKHANDFPDYVDVTPAGPTAIRNYEAMGYILIELKRE